MRSMFQLPLTLYQLQQSVAIWHSYQPVAYCRLQHPVAFRPPDYAPYNIDNRQSYFTPARLPYPNTSHAQPTNFVQKEPEALPSCAPDSNECEQQIENSIIRILLSTQCMVPKLLIDMMKSEKVIFNSVVCI